VLVVKCGSESKCEDEVAVGDEVVVTFAFDDGQRYLSKFLNMKMSLLRFNNLLLELLGFLLLLLLLLFN
jgi:hypothetical protein